jgi:hypothetical protein
VENSILLSDAEDSFSDQLSSHSLFFDLASSTGLYNVTSAIAYDKAGNWVEYSAAQLTAMGIVTSFRVAHGPSHNAFNADGLSDLLWRSDTGQFSDWLAHANGDGGFTGNDASALTGVPTSWHVAGTGDFNGDGREDVLWRSDSGQLSDWLAHSNGDGGFTNNDANAFVGVPTAWTVAGIGDFNGDGRSDILWRNTSSGQLSNWLGTASGGFTANDANALIGVPTTWTVAGTGDFNGDGISDLLWRGPNGEVSDWLGTSAGGWSINDANALKVVPSNWHIVAVGDFNGDAISDMLWRSDGGQISDWLGQSNGGFVMNDANALIGVPTSWHVAGTGDYNGDGIDDLLWRSTSGQLSDWLGQSTGGFTSNDAHAFVTVPTSWHVQDPFVHDPFGTV